MKGGGTAYADDNLCDPASNVVSGNGHLVHALRVHPYPSYRGDSSVADTRNSRTTADLRNNRPAEWISEPGGRYANAYDFYSFSILDQPWVLGRLLPNQ